MKQMELTARLKQIADMVPQGFSVADIGTDHGYLPIYLVVKGISPCVLACDLRPGPLERAKAHVREQLLENSLLEIDVLQRGRCQAMW